MNLLSLSNDLNGQTEAFFLGKWLVISLADQRKLWDISTSTNFSKKILKVEKTLHLKMLIALLFIKEITENKLNAG